MKHSEIRKDYIQDKYVIIAPKRGKRPHDTKKIKTNDKQPSTNCVFCPENINKAGKILYTTKKSSEKKNLGLLKF